MGRYGYFLELHMYLLTVSNDPQQIKYIFSFFKASTNMGRVCLVLVPTPNWPYRPNQNQCQKEIYLQHLKQCKEKDLKWHLIQIMQDSQIDFHFLVQKRRIWHEIKSHLGPFSTPLHLELGKQNILFNWRKATHGEWWGRQKMWLVIGGLSYCHCYCYCYCVNTVQSI